jgi:hypothetical protein
MAELGAGGGKGDLDQQHELEVGDASALGMLMSLCATKMQDQPKLLSSVMEMLASIMRDPVRAIALDATILYSEQLGRDQDGVTELEQMPLDRLIPILASLAVRKGERSNEDAAVLPTEQAANLKNRSTNLPNRIVSHLPFQYHMVIIDIFTKTFPYSRHSSYTELCHLIEAFKPKDIWPCTVDKANWSAAQSMSFLFGHLYDTPCKFAHDQEMFRKTGKAAAAVVPESVPGTPETHVKRTASTNDLVGGNDPTCKPGRAHPTTSEFSSHGRDGLYNAAASYKDSARLVATPQDGSRPDVISAGAVVNEAFNEATRKRRRSDDHVTRSRTPSTVPLEGGTNHPSSGSRVIPEATHAGPSALSTADYSEAWKQQAFEAALGTSSTDWNDITLVSVSGHQEREQEL